MLNINDGFRVGSGVSIDSRIVIEKIEDLKNVNHNLQPNVYFALCEEDKRLYIYNKDADPDELYGRFRPFEGGGGIPDEWETKAIDFTKDIEQL